MIKIDCVWFDIDSKLRLSCTWIDMGLRNPYGVGHLLHVKVGHYRGLLRIAGILEDNRGWVYIYPRTVDDGYTRGW